MMMQVWSASQPAPGQLDNEDHVFRYGPLVGVLDGATVPDGFDTGCVHGPAWYVRHLAARLGLAEAERPAATLAGNLAAAISAVRSDHGGLCDLDHPGTPSSTVCLLRHRGDHVDYLVLCDSPLVVDQSEYVRVIADDRLAAAMADVRRTAATISAADGADRATYFRRAVAVQRRAMNQTHGYWVAAANPDAAFHAITGTLPLFGPQRLRRAALLSDGTSCAVEQFALFDWAGLLDTLSEHGPGELVRRVRVAEDATAEHATAEHAEHRGRAGARYKRHDDATAALCVFDEECVQPGRRGNPDGRA